MPIPDDLVANLLTWKYGKEDDLFFPFKRITAFRIVSEACSRAGITDERAHPNRHS